MAAIRTKNRFGRRYLRLRDFMHYSEDLDILVDYPPEGLFEFLDREALLRPVARVRFPPEIARRFEQEKDRGVTLIDPIEPDTDRLKHAWELHLVLSQNRWGNPAIYGEHAHVLDLDKPEHAPFITREEGAAAHTPWKELSTPLWMQDGKAIGDARQYAELYYHYWQVFLLAALMRTGVKVLYPPEDDQLAQTVWKLDLADASIRRRLYATHNLEARHEARVIVEHRRHFEAVAYFTAYAQHALNVFVHDVDKKTGRLSFAQSRKLRKREKEIAKQAIARYDLSAEDILSFVEAQCGWWSTASDRGPKRVADEYKRNIDAALRLYMLLTREKFAAIAAKVKSSHGYFKPVLNVIFPSWLEEQRDLAERSLFNWAQADLSTLPAPFAMSRADVTAFCDWIDANGLHQIYWHFSRLVELGRGDGDVHRAAKAGEVVGLANFAELVANVVMEEHKHASRGHTLSYKLRLIADAAKFPRLSKTLKRFGESTSTKKSTLKKRLAQIGRIKRGGQLAPVVRTLLGLQVIRNEGSHLGLLRFDDDELHGMIETMAVASLMIWRMRP